MKKIKILIIAAASAALAAGLIFLGRVYFSRTYTHMNGKGGSCVVLIHGLFRGPESMEDIARLLKERGHSIINFAYSSRNETMESIANRLFYLIEKNAGNDIRNISFVTHSLGSLVGRYYISRYRIDRLKRMVMIAPPNRGSVWSRILDDKIPFMKSIIGESDDIINNGIAENEMIPECEFGIIAGGLGDGEGYNPLIPGDDDMTVGVEETRLKGMKDFILVKGQHSNLLTNKIVIDNVAHFLDKGYFIKGKGE
jgi:uncharacterized alpha/beta hydrolase family protein